MSEEVVCRLCGRKFSKVINVNHLRSHGIKDIREYYLKYFSFRKDFSFSYLVGYWVGDGVKGDVSVSFLVGSTNVGKVENFVREVVDGVTVEYDPNTTMLMFRGENSRALCIHIKNEVVEKLNIRKNPWDFICGFLDSDGSVDIHYHKEDERIISIYFTNTNLGYLSILQEIFTNLHIPYSLEQVYEKGTITEILGCAVSSKTCYNLHIDTRAATYIASTKLKLRTIDPMKRERFEKYIEYYKEKHLKRKLPISEIFNSIQGEGKNTGNPQTFVRCYECNLHCWGCDTVYSWKRKSRKKKLGHIRTIESVVEEIKRRNLHSVCLTGGEFMLCSRRLAPLIAFLKENDYSIVLQTNGTIYDRTIFSLVDCVSVDLKSPSTRVQSDISIMDKLSEKDEIKTLIATDEDYEFAKKINKRKKDDLPHVLQVFDLTGKREDMLEALRKLGVRVLDDLDRGYQWRDIRVGGQLHKLEGIC